MTAVLLAGAGAVGRRAARQLAETDGIERVLVADRDVDHVARVQAAIGGAIVPVDWTPGDPVPDGVAAVACALPPGPDRLVAERALEVGVPCATTTDDLDATRRLLDLDDLAREAGVALAVGCGLAPGLSDVLAAHAIDALDAVDEVHVARYGTAGPACTLEVHRAATGTALEWRDGAWLRARAGSGRQLVWFPEPVGGADCYRVGSGQVLLLADAFSPARASMRHAARRRDRVTARLPVVRRPGPEGGWGAVRVEVRGRRGIAHEITVLGVVDRMAIASGTVLAVAAASLAGVAGGTPRARGAHGLGAVADPVPFLAELARRGVKAAAFDGSAAA